MRKLVVLDKIDDLYEPYDRPYILQTVATLCHKNATILKNTGYTSVWRRGYLAHQGVWENHCKWVSCVCFEIDELTPDKCAFLFASIGSYAVELEVLPTEWETTIIYPSEFRS
jgi:hypothetical protein